MQNNIPEIENLIKQIAKLPGLGPKSAKRIVLKIINHNETLGKPLANALVKVLKNIESCKECGNLKMLNHQCKCFSKNGVEKLCVVESLADMWTIESANIFKGSFHILGGNLTSNGAFEQGKTLMESLEKRVKNNNFKEVIIATSATIEGQTTAHYIENLIKDHKVKITKLGLGIPVGGEIEQLDDGTLLSAFNNRVPVTTKPK